MKEVELYWESLWGKSITQRKDGMDKKRIKIKKIYVYELDTRKDYGNHFCQKIITGSLLEATNSKLPAIILRNSSNNTRRTKQIPDWLTPGRTYIPPILEDIKEQKVYRQTT
jgi:hypothetical protein